MIARWAVLGILVASLAGLIAPLQAAAVQPLAPSAHPAPETIVEGMVISTSSSGGYWRSVGQVVRLLRVDETAGTVTETARTTVVEGNTFGFWDVPAYGVYYVTLVDGEFVGGQPCEAPRLFWAAPEAVVQVEIHCSR